MSEHENEPEVEGTPSEAPEPEAAPPEQAPTVHLLVERSEDGSVTVEPVATGDVRVTEVESIIRIGLKRWLEKAGLGV